MPHPLDKSNGGSGDEVASSTTPRRRNLLVALAQYTVTHFRSSSTKSSSWLTGLKLTSFHYKSIFHVNQLLTTRRLPCVSAYVTRMCKINRVSNSRFGISLESEPELTRISFVSKHEAGRILLRNTGPHDSVQAPIRHKVLRGIKCPWSTSATKRFMNGRDSFLRKGRKTGSVVDWSTYRRLRNQVSKRIKIEKRRYLGKKFRIIWSTRNHFGKLESIFPNKERYTSTVQYIITDELLYPSFVYSFIQVSHIRGLRFLMIVYNVITVLYIVLSRFQNTVYLIQDPC